MKLRISLPVIGFLAPNLVGFTLFTLGPVLFSLIVAFTDWDLTRHNELSGQSVRWIGFENFQKLLFGSEREQFWHYFGNTLYLMGVMPVSIACSLALALCLHGQLRGKIAFRTISYLPTITAGVALYLLWKAMLRPQGGLVNQLLAYVGVAGPEWLGSTVWSKSAIMLMGFWTAIGGTNMLLYLAGLANVPVELSEAAAIDGASRWQRFRHVIWPQLAPTTFFIVVMSLIGGLQGGFEQARVMTQGGPAGSTTTLSYYIYQKGFQEYQLGTASAIAWVLFLIVMALTLVNWRFGNRTSE